MTVPTARQDAVATTTRPADGEHAFSVVLDLRHDYLQSVDFRLAGVGLLDVDEPPPLGHAEGPNPARLLGSALGSCLGASLLFCLRKARIEVNGLHTTVNGTLVRNERGRLRVGAVDVTLEPIVPAAQHERMTRCLTMFEDFCVVTASVRQAIEVRVSVVPREG